MHGFLTNGSVGLSNGTHKSQDHEEANDRSIDGNREYFAGASSFEVASETKDIEPGEGFQENEEENTFSQEMFPSVKDRRATNRI